MLSLFGPMNSAKNVSGNLFTILLFIYLSGCATNMFWSIPNKTELREMVLAEDYEKAEEFCERQRNKERHKKCYLYMAVLVDRKYKHGDEEREYIEMARDQARIGKYLEKASPESRSLHWEEEKYVRYGNSTIDLIKEWRKRIWKGL